MVFTPHHQQDNKKISLSRARRWLSVFSILGLAAGVTCYIALTNSVATKGYDIKQLQQELEAVKFSARQLETEVAAKKSFKTLEEMDIPEGFVAVERVEYLSAVPLAGVAVK